MELFAVTFFAYTESSADRFTRFLSRTFKERPDGGRAAVRWEIDAAGRIARCLSDAAKPPGHARIAGLMRKTADAAASFIVRELQPELIHGIARKEFGGEKEEDLAGIETYSLQFLAGEPGTKQVLLERRRRRMADELAQCLAEYGKVDLDGFVTFRLGAFRKELRDVVAYAAQEYLMDRQYREFVKLLKYVADVQETRMPIVHLIHRGSGGEFQMRDGRFHPLEQGRPDGAAPKLHLLRTVLETQKEQQSDGEDMIVSALISASPRRIVVHSRQPGLPAVKTIESIFAGRVRICPGCGSCAPFFGEEGRPTDRKST